MIEEHWKSFYFKQGFLIKIACNFYIQFNGALFVLFDQGAENKNMLEKKKVVNKKHLREPYMIFLE